MSRSEYLNVESLSYDYLSSVLLSLIDDDRLMRPPSPDDLDRREEQIAIAVCESVPGQMTKTEWKGLNKIEREPWMEKAIAKLQSPNTPATTTRKRGRQSNAEQDKKIAEEYWSGLEKRSWTGQADYLRQKHCRRHRENQNSAKAWLSTLLKRVKKLKESGDV
jgi:hypothetical protein